MDRSHTSPPHPTSDDAEPIAPEGCPYLDRNDQRCASRFSLGRMDQMLDICLGNGRSGCFMYHRICHEDAQQAVRDASTTPMTPTYDGQPLRLRPTGS